MGSEWLIRCDLATGSLHYSQAYSIVNDAQTQPSTPPPKVPSAGMLAVLSQGNLPGGEKAPAD